MYTYPIVHIYVFNKINYDKYFCVWVKLSQRITE